MTCEYEWKVDWGTTMSFACGNCPFNPSDCSNPECMAANGVARPVMTANRMLPGPQINVCQGDLIRVLVHAELFMSEGITIHWLALLIYIIDLFFYSFVLKARNHSKGHSFHGWG